MSEIKNYGKVVMTFEGDWDSNKLYDRLCVVRYKNLTYVSKKDNLIDIAPSNSEDWELLSTPGIKGDQGPKGDKGDQGLPAVSYKNVTIFSTYNPTTEKPYPNKPIGGYWDVSSDIIIFPEGWTNEDNILAPVWMSIGTFSSSNPDNPVWTIPQRISGEKGNNGADGISQEFIYCLTKNQNIQPPAITNSNTDNHVPTGWTASPKGINEYNQVEWYASRKKDSLGNWLDFEGPFIWSKWGVNGLDGDGVQYIFKLNKGEAIKNPIEEFNIDINSDQYQEKGDYKDIEYKPTNWSDNPQGVDHTNTHEWCCKRKFKNGKWGAYSNPALWAKYSENGINGTNGISVITKYAKTDNSSEIPPFEKENNNPGSIWGSIIPHYESPEALWEIQAYVDYKGNLVEITNDDESITYGWQGPVLKSGVAGEKGAVPNYKSTYFCKADSIPNKPTYKTLSEIEGSSIWLDYPNNSGQWWQSTALIDGNTEEIISWGNVLQVNGQDGIAQDGKYWETRFAVSLNDATPELNKYNRDPSTSNVNWIKPDVATPPPTIPEGGSLWQIWAEIQPGGTTLVNGWSDPYRVNGERGPRGYTGATGQTGAQGPSGIHGVSFEVIYCLGTDNEYLGNNPQTDGTFDNFWNLVVPEVNEEYNYIWCSQGKKIYSDNEGNYSIAWGKPFRLSGINGIGEQGVGVTKIENYYAISNDGINAPSDEDWEEEGIIPELDKNYPYLWNYEIVKYSNGTEQKTEPQVISLIGQDGRNIKQIIEYYYVGPEAEGVTIDNVEWKTEPLYPNDVNIYLWNREEIIFDKGKPIKLDPIRIGNYSKGEAGETGPIGKTVYPAGIYNSETTYTCNETSCPYVLDTSDGNYYLLNADKWESGQTITPSQSFLTNPYKYWSKMDFYEAVFAKIGVIANGLFGSAVFNGDYMFSQQGTTTLDGVTPGDYKDFNPYNPFIDGNSFYPNICFNFKTGEVWLAKGKIKFNADSSGSLVNDKLKWDKNGNLYINGVLNFNNDNNIVESLICGNDAFLEEDSDYGKTIFAAGIPDEDSRGSVNIKDRTKEALFKLYEKGHIKVNSAEIGGLSVSNEGFKAPVGKIINVGTVLSPIWVTVTTELTLDYKGLSIGDVSINDSGFRGPVYIGIKEGTTIFSTDNKDGDHGYVDFYNRDGIFYGIRPNCRLITNDSSASDKRLTQFDYHIIAKPTYATLEIDINKGILNKENKIPLGQTFKIICRGSTVWPIKINSDSSKQIFDVTQNKIVNTVTITGLALVTLISLEDAWYAYY